MPAPRARRESDTQPWRRAPLAALAFEGASRPVSRFILTSVQPVEVMRHRPGPVAGHVRQPRRPGNRRGILVSAPTERNQQKIGRASCRERVVKNVELSVVAEQLK